ncbi:hypothetical protein, partial [Actinomadura luteofluorescens]|uniref:hypothetical protein n=1 Tax=Actinomadura luteofluorescens TaxID=46163 RepID=UPI0031D91F67
SAAVIRSPRRERSGRPDQANGAAFGGALLGSMLLLTARTEAERPRCDIPACRRRDVRPSNAVGLLAAIREH